MIIVTGGAGFIGSAFIAKLNAEGIKDIVVVDDLGCTDKWKNLSNKQFLHYLNKDQFLTKISSDSLPGKVKAVVHLGACSATTEPNAEYLMQNNYRYSKLVAEWAIKKGVRFVYASSAATYGDGKQGFSDESLESLIPLNGYAFSKQAFDIWATQTGFVTKMAGVKFFNVYGPNEYHKQDMRSVIAKAFEQINETGELKLFKSDTPDFEDGGQKRDFIYVKDCAEVLYWLLHNNQCNGIFNLGTGKARSWNDLAAAVFAAMEKEKNVNYIDMPEQLKGKYQNFTEAKMTKLQQAGCDVEFHSLEDGIKDYVRNYLQSEFQYL